MQQGLPDEGRRTYIPGMAYYLVSAVPKNERLPELAERLERDEFLAMRPFGRSLTAALKGARIRKDGVAVWEEEDYCRPPLAQERAAVLDHYFDDLKVDAVAEGEGWRRIEAYPPLFPAFAGS